MIKAKSILIFIFWVCSLPSFLSAQTRHELKVDGFSIYNNFTFNTKFNLQLSYEAALKKRIGLEVGLGFNSGIATINEGSLASPNVTIFDYDQQYLQFYAVGKYYFLSKDYAEGLWGGLYTFHQFETYKDPDYFEKVHELNLEGFQYIDRPYERLELGLSLGYKWLIKEHFIVEPFFGIGLDFSRLLISDINYSGLSVNDISAVYQLNLGYRF